MTNEQLIVLLTSWANRLEREIDLLSLSLPEDMERGKKPVYIGKIPELYAIDHNPEHWTYEPGDFIAMFGLQDFLSELREGIDILKGE